MKFGKKVLVFLIAAALISSNGCVTAIADDSLIGIQTEDFESGNGLGMFAGSIGGSVTAYEEKDGNHCMYVAPYTDGVTAFAQYKLNYSEKVKLNVSFDFKQKDKRTDGVCPLGLSRQGVDLVRLETKNGNIVMKKESSSMDIILVEGYAVNRYYHISVDVDYSNGFASVYVDGELKAEEQPLLKHIKTADVQKTADTMYFSTKYSPGICIDNVKITPQQYIERIEFEGETELNVSDKKNSEYTYTAKAYDQNGLNVKNYVSFMISPQNEGVTLKQGSDKAYITVTSEAAGKNFTLSAQAGSVTVTKELTVNSYSSKLDKIVINGDAKLASKMSGLSEYPYKARFFDQFGDELYDEQCTFSLEGNVPDTIELDSESGIITVNGELPKDKHITLIAASKSNPDIKAKKTLTLLDAETYADDTARFETLVSYVDHVREIGRDPYNNTPLIADVWDRSTQQPGEWRSGTSSGVGVTSNLANKGGWFRTLDLMYKVTGDEQYKKEITDTYRYYLDNYIDDASNIPYWGGHAAVDLKTGKAYLINNTHCNELKNHSVYMDPFFELDPNKAAKMVKSMICAHMTDWSGLMFNRHGEYFITPDYSQWDTWKTWKNTLQSETFGKDCYVHDSNISFRATGNDLVDSLGTLYRYTGDEAASTWAMNFLDCYWRVENPDTLVGGYQTSSGKDAPGQKALPKNWWTPQNYQEVYSYASYGDRFYNQFADDLVDQGFLSEEDKWMAIEPFLSHPDDYSTTLLHSLLLANGLGYDSENGKRILEHDVKKMVKHLDLAYYPDTNKFASRLLSNGTSLDGLIMKKCGYYGTDIGTKWDSYYANVYMRLAYAQLYLATKDRDDLKEYRDKIYAYLRNHYQKEGFGELGEKYPGDNVNLDLNTAVAEGVDCMIMQYLYQATGVTEYLDVARRIADNFINNNMVDGLFWLNSDNNFIPLGGWKSERMHYALAMLEATVCGEWEDIPPYVPCDGYFADASWNDLEKGISNTECKSGDRWFDVNTESVEAKKIILPESEIHMSVGDEKFLEITILPSDADNSVIYGSTAPDCVVIDYKTNKLIARKKGTAQITISSSDNSAKATLNVIVD